MGAPEASISGRLLGRRWRVASGGRCNGDHGHEKAMHVVMAFWEGYSARPVIDTGTRRFTVLPDPVFPVSHMVWTLTTYGLSVGAPPSPKAPSVNSTCKAYPSAHRERPTTHHLPPPTYHLQTHLTPLETPPSLRPRFTQISVEHDISDDVLSAERRTTNLNLSTASFQFPHQVHRAESPQLNVRPSLTIGEPLRWADEA
ncbi:hypothetical protein BZA05DRAFT_432473 [Tricharina praecox]|uniref:uncharacterized protein n=1 Tax=Tricharina praecox TaxID=43433 RepID=UPI00221ECC2C|nr:uncharacterized protein BZA05DRAFT_432473 [Tricharina praecox]KAI5858579.1 hypothetical protein BZA05DRAFT_432473 [Tricharina praecox]